MKATQLLALAGISMLAMSSSCEKNSGPEPAPVTDAPLAVTLKLGQQQVVGPLTVKLVAIKELRCAREDCSLCYGGYAPVQVDITAPDLATQHLTFNRLSCLGPDDLTLAPSDSLRASLQQVGGFRVGLINMTDFVRANKVDPSTYTVKFLFEKK